MVLLMCLPFFSAPFDLLSGRRDISYHFLLACYNLVAHPVGWTSPIGAIILMLSPLCWAFGSAWSHHLQLPPGLMASAAQMLIGGVFVTVLGLILGQRITSVPTMQSLLALLYLITFGSLLAFSVYGYLLRHVRPALATSYAYVNPVVAVCLGVIFAGEHSTVMTVVAMVVILGGVGLISFGHGKA